MSTDAQSTPLLDCITYHAWNRDQSQIAVACNTNELYIYHTNNQINNPHAWIRKHTLSEHSGYISCIDWSYSTNHLVSCGHDRNAYVWKYDSPSDKWIPTLVILRINRAATYVRWSHDGLQFSVCSGSKQLAICYYEVTNDWWISKMIKKFKSTVLCVAWSPCNTYIITGSSDRKCRIFSVNMNKSSSTTTTAVQQPYIYNTIFQSSTFGDIVYEFDGGSWINSVDWSPDGTSCAYATQSSRITFINLTSNELIQSSCKSPIQLPSLPYLSIVYLSSTQLIGAGFNMNIDLYTCDNSTRSWSYTRSIDTSGQSVLAPVKQVATSAFSTARGLFGDVVQKGGSFGSKIEDTSITTKHKNNIVNICLLQQPTIDTPCTKFTTASLDGRICAWDINQSVGDKVTDAVASALSAVKI